MARGVAAGTGAFDGLDRALRWLRDRRGAKQYQVAAAAGITKAMLSAYETGRQRPTLDTLEKLLRALEADLRDLDDTLRIVGGKPAPTPSRSPSAQPGPPPLAAEVSLPRLLEDPTVPTDEAAALTAAVEAHYRWLRVLRKKALEEAPP